MTDELLNKLTDFSLKYFPYTDRNLIKDYLQIHENNNTLLYALDDQGEVIGILRFNAYPETGVGDILDFAIREDWRNKGLFRDFVKHALKTWPMGKYLKFYRGLKKVEDREITIPIKFILAHNF